MYRFPLPFQIRLILIALIFVHPFSAKSQQVSQVYIYPASAIVAHPNASVNIFSDVINTGTFTSHTGSNITFYGSSWQNLTGYRLPDESATGLDAAGGIFTFSGIYAGAQSIVNTNAQPYNGFPNLNIDNQQHVTLQTGNLYVNNNLNFTNGSVILNGLDLSLGRLGKGTVTGYSQNGFVVTGTGFTGGSLIRSTDGTAAQTLVFPVGTTTTSYTPASLSFTGLANNLKVRVADGVYSKPAFPEYVYKTWAVGLEYPDPAATLDLALQHNTIDEGTDYFRNRADAYVSRYNKNIVGLYDIVPASPSVTPGTITGRTPVGNAYVNTRTAITRLAPLEYFTKSSIKKLVEQNTPSFMPEAISPNGDGINDTYKITKRLPADVVRLEIYTRNQVLVYRSFDYQNDFDGTGNIGGFMGNVLPDGIYYYLISANNAKGVPGYLVINR